MVSSNHVNYWNYLETVTADRNKEAIQRELNTTTQAVNLAQAEKLVSDKKLSEGLALKALADTDLSKANRDQSLAMAKSILANIDFSERLTTNKEGELKFQIGKLATEFGLKKVEVAAKLLELDIELKKLEQQKDIATADREAKYLEIFARLMGSIVGAAGGVVKGGK